MVAEEFCLEVLQENINSQGFDEEEDSLSLRNLAMDEVKADDYRNYSFREEQSSLFEFVCQDSIAPACSTENVIFCGKLIRIKDARKTKSNKRLAEQEKQGKRCNLKQKFNSFRNLSIPSSMKQKLLRERKFKKYSPLIGFDSNARCSENFDSSVEKSPMLSTRKQFKWYSLAFGPARFPMGMKLEDIKRRQSQKSPAIMFLSRDEGEVVKSTRKKGNGFWGLLRFLVGKNRHARSAAKVPFDRKSK